MTMRLANFMDRTPVRVAVLCVVLAATLGFAPWAFYGASVGLEAYLRGVGPDGPGQTGLFWVGVGGLLGMAGAWIRLLYRADQLRGLPGLRYAAAVALGAGTVTAFALLVGVGPNLAEPKFWMYAATTLVAGSLFLATLLPA